MNNATPDVINCLASEYYISVNIYIIFIIISDVYIVFLRVEAYMLVITPQITEHYGKIKRRWLREGKGSLNYTLHAGR
jgi:hypothetical protein